MAFALQAPPPPLKGDKALTHKRILIRESKTPFENVWHEPIPPHAYKRVFNSQHQNGKKNYGNFMFGHAVYKTLSAPGVDFGIDQYNLTLREYSDGEIEAINSQYDAVVLPMDDALRLQHRGPDLVARLALNVSRLKIPTIIVGIGARFRLEHHDFDDLKPMERDIKLLFSSVLDRSESVAVRGEVTRDYLIHLGFPQDRIEAIGCPSIYYNGEHMEVRKGPLESVAFYLTPGIKDSRILPFTDYYNKHSNNVVYLPQERGLMKMFIDNNYPTAQSENTIDNQAPKLHQPEKVAFICDIVPWMDYLKSKSFSIGTRIHGNIVSLLAGTPGHVICHDSRTLEMSRYLEIPHTTYAQLANFDGTRVYEESDYTGLMKNHRARLAKYAAFLERNDLAHILYDKPALLDYDAKVRRSIAEAKLPSVFAHHPVTRRIKRKVSKLIGSSPLTPATA